MQSLKQVQSDKTTLAALPIRRSADLRELFVALKRSVPRLVAIIVMSTVLLFIQSEFAAIVAPWLLSSWLFYMAGCVFFLIGTFLGSLVPGWRAARGRLFWIRLGQVSSIAFSLGIAVSVWILMPPANDNLRFLMVLLCMWFIAMVIILNPDRASVAGAVLVVSSMAIFTLRNELPYALPLAGFLIMEGVALVLIRRQVWRAAATLETALALMKSERDAKTRFIAAASHDLQQPLLAASLYFDNAMASQDDGARKAAVNGAQQALGSTRALLHGMLEFLRLEAGAETVRPQEFDLGQVVQNAIIEQAAGAQSAGLELIAVPFKRLVWTDPLLVARILSNLIANAIQHSGGTRVLIGATRRGQTLLLWVIDDGQGVAAADFDRVFEDYTQGQRTGRHPGGFGLGLASSRRMAELMHGSLDLDARWPRGCAFVLKLPILSPS